MAIIANDSQPLSSQLLSGFVVAVLLHLAVFAAFPALAPTKVIKAALQSGATILHISITQPQQKPVAQPPAPAKIHKRAAQKNVKPQPVTPKAVYSPPQSIVKAAPAPQKQMKTPPIPTTTQVSLRGKRIAPTYPKRALRMKQEGTVMLKVLVDESGGQKRIQLSRSSQFPLLDRAALEAVRKWRFNPTIRGDEAILSWVQVPIEFRIR